MTTNWNIYNIGTRVIVCLALCCWQACATTDSDDPQPADGRVAVELAFSVSTTQGDAAKAPTRMGSTTVQSSEEDFRGVQDLRLIPLDGNRDISGDAITNFTPQGDTRNYLASNIAVMNIGTERFLGYGKAVPLTGEGQALNIKNGVIRATFDNESLANTHFDLAPIVTDASDYSPAETMAFYLTAIAKALKAGGESYNVLYTEFISKASSTGDATDPIAGSTKNVIKWVELLESKLENFPSDSKQAITEAIAAFNSPVPATEYPKNIHLPDGAATMKWIENAPDGATDAATYPKFVVLKTSDASNPMSDHTRFAYPAELYYFQDSEVLTSKTSHTEAYADKTTWTDITDLYTDGDVVTSTTRSVAVKDPLDYAVGLLELHVTSEATDGAGGKKVLMDNNSYLKKEDDPEDHPISFGSNSFPLTGIMIGGQFRQHYDFTPLEKGKDEGGTDPVEYIIYDTDIPTKEEEGAIHLWTTDEEKEKYTQTLVLQTRDTKPIDIVLEFENNSGNNFIGFNGGTVYTGTKFYLIGQAWPSTIYGVEPYEQRVFTKDYKTVLTLSVQSLRNAYNVIPELKTATYSIRVADVAVKKWDSRLYEEHDFYNW